ncbi:hypothetical protein R3P38DRAFT_2527025, partial [Favolaschia claudopus]
SFGGLLPGCTSCQMNVSSDGFDLAHFIGSHQGAWHTDIGDDWTRWTLVTMLLNLPPGSDPGAFCLGRCGLYVREADAWIVFLVFRGNDLHSGFAPTTPPVAVEDVNKLVNAAGPNRVVYVSYPSRVATTRAGSMSMSPPTNFWNSGSMSAAKTEQRHFTDTSSTQIFGGLETKANRLAREAAYSFANALTHSGIQLDITLTDLMQRMTYRCDNGQTKTIGPPPFDITHQAVEMNRWWRFYEWHRNLCNKYLIRITKSFAMHKHKSKQLKLRPTCTPMLISTKRNQCCCSTFVNLLSSSIGTTTELHPLRSHGPSYRHSPAIWVFCRLESRSSVWQYDASASASIYVWP